MSGVLRAEISSGWLVLSGALSLLEPASHRPQNIIPNSLQPPGSFLHFYPKKFFERSVATFISAPLLILEREMGTNHEKLVINCPRSCAVTPQLPVPTATTTRSRGVGMG